jgi:hypothetical protein
MEVLQSNTLKSYIKISFNLNQRILTISVLLL